MQPLAILLSRDRPKSAPYLRLKNSKRLQNVKVLVNLEPFMKKLKSLTMPKKTERGDPLGFFNIHSVAKLQKIEEGTLWWKKIEKSYSAEKNLFGLVRCCMLRRKPFWFSSLGQQVQLGVFSEFCRTFGRTILVSSGLFWS